MNVETFLDETAVAEFIEGVRGEVLRPDEAGYDDAREIWNAMIDRHPALIARCAGVADVIAAECIPSGSESEYINYQPTFWTSSQKESPSGRRSLLEWGKGTKMI